METATTLTLILFFLFCICFLYVSLKIKEEFANPVDQTYDPREFFKPFPLDQVCPIYTDVYTSLYKLEKIDTNGAPVPDDIARKNALASIKQKAGGPLLSCPFSFPEGKDLDTIHPFVTGLPPQVLANGYRTLLFCKQQLTNAVVNSKKSLAEMPPKIKEGFIELMPAVTECSAEELAERTVIPLQCIAPEVERGDQQDAVKAADPDELRMVTQKKKDITKALKAMHVSLTMTYPKGYDYAAVITDCRQLQKELTTLQQKAQAL